MNVADEAKNIIIKQLKIRDIEKNALFNLMVWLDETFDTSFLVDEDINNFKTLKDIVDYIEYVTKDPLFNEVKEMVKESFSDLFFEMKKNGERPKLPLNADFVKDLGASVLDIETLHIKLEDRLKTYIDYSDIDKYITSLKNTYEYVKKAIENQDKNSE